MDPVDYLRLDQHLRSYEIPSSQAHKRSPIMAVHDVPVQPGWNNVLVCWDVSPDSHNVAIKVAQFDYAAVGDEKYSQQREPRPPNWLPFRINDDAVTFRGEPGAWEALNEFARRVHLYADQTIDNQTPRP